MNASTLEKKVTLVDDRVRFDASLHGNPDIRIDAEAPIGHGDGASPAELFLISISACFGMAVTSLVRDRLRHDVTSAHVTAQGTLRDEHPKGFTHIAMHLDIASPGLTQEELARAVDSAENKICPILSMVRGNVDVRSTFAITK